jgi:hypothetical protein
MVKKSDVQSALEFIQEVKTKAPDSGEDVN